MPRERRFTDEQQAQLCARVHCHHRREMHHYGSRGCLAEMCACLSFINPPTVPAEQLWDPKEVPLYTVPATTEAERLAMEPVFTLRAGKVAHYRVINALVGMLIEGGAPEAEIGEAIQAMNAMITWRLRNCADITKDVS
jgi:hypothetical protein